MNMLLGALILGAMALGWFLIRKSVMRLVGAIKRAQEVKEKCEPQKK